MKTKILFLLIFSCCQSVSQPWAGNNIMKILDVTVIAGDANCDGNVNVIDVYMAMDYILETNPQPFCFENADVNVDGIINTVDIVGITSIILGAGFACGFSTLTDIDGNVYKTVLINDKCWIKENLKTTKYRNGANIQYPGSNYSAWMFNTTGAYAWYNNDLSYKNLYGAFYNWHAVNNQSGLCPTGWHIPTDAEWTSLSDFAGGNSVAGGKMKSTKTAPRVHPRWNSPNIGANDQFGFSALPGGYRFGDGSFNLIGYCAYFWSSSEDYSPNNALYRRLDNYNALISRHSILKHTGFSVRCVKD